MPVSSMLSIFFCVVRHQMCHDLGRPMLGGFFGIRGRPDRPSQWDVYEVFRFAYRRTSPADAEKSQTPRSAALPCVRSWSTATVSGTEVSPKPVQMLYHIPRSRSTSKIDERGTRRVDPEPSRDPLSSVSRLRHAFLIAES